MKITKDIVKYWTEEQFQKYRLISWNSTHQQKLKNETFPEWYMFSKETLISLIPFSQKPTLEDLGQFFLCMKDYVSGNYDLSEPEFDALLGIGCDLGFSALSLALGGAAAFATFGLSTILSVLGCAVTLGYICDNMAIIGRIYKKRKAENNMKLENNGEEVVVA